MGAPKKRLGTESSATRAALVDATGQLILDEGYSFFFQAEDGIRDFHVTGVQTCALPIFQQQVVAGIELVRLGQAEIAAQQIGHCAVAGRSEERRVGKECRSRWSPYH